MTPETDRNFRQEQAVTSVTMALNKTLKFLLAILTLLAVIQVGLLIWVAGQCSFVYGISVEGRVFPTHSFTCPFAGVEPIFHGKPRI